MNIWISISVAFIVSLWSTWEEVIRIRNIEQEPNERDDIFLTRLKKFKGERIKKIKYKGWFTSLLVISFIVTIFITKENQKKASREKQAQQTQHLIDSIRYANDSIKHIEERYRDSIKYAISYEAINKIQNKASEIADSLLFVDSSIKTNSSMLNESIISASKSYKELSASSLQILSATSLLYSRSQHDSSIMMLMSKEKLISTYKSIGDLLSPFSLYTNKLKNPNINKDSLRKNISFLVEESLRLSRNETNNPFLNQDTRLKILWKGFISKLSSLYSDISLYNAGPFVIADKLNRYYKFFQNFSLIIDDSENVLPKNIYEFPSEQELEKMYPSVID